MPETATERATKPWQVRLICCGRDDGIMDVATRGEAEMLRSQYTAAEGHDRAAIIHGPADRQEHDPGAILAQYLAALRADNGMRSIVGDCIALLNAVIDERDQLRRQLDAAEAQPCDHDSTAFEALERLHARIHRDFNFDASESAAPDDERWARVMDDLVRFADEVYLPLADATKTPGPLESAVTEALADLANDDQAEAESARPAPPWLIEAGDD